MRYATLFYCTMRYCFYLSEFIALCFECIRSYFFSFSRRRFLSLSLLLTFSFFLPRLVLVTVPFSILSITSPAVPSSSRSFILHGRHRQFQNKTLFNYLNRLHFLGRIAQLFPHCIENKEKATMNVIWS